jgi:hypothetical protein
MFAEFIEVQKLLNTVPPRQSGEKNKNKKFVVFSIRTILRSMLQPGISAFYLNVLQSYFVSNAFCARYSIGQQA